MKKPTYSSKVILSQIEKKKSPYWQQLQKKNSLALFYEAAVRVPAYKDFLKKNKINYKLIKSWEDFLSLPTINKKNYINKYPLKDLCWDGSISKPMILTATSGSTGEPSYFLRQEMLDWQYSLSMERYIKRAINGSRGSTLFALEWVFGLED
ncbi:MAG: hypothetical protein O3B87_03980 [bacterium]|nr:hypothetical protein [bacterium]